MSVYPPGKTDKDVDKVYKEAYQETKIDYSYTGGFFTPGLKNINHLEVGRSKIINSFIVIVAERILVFYQRFKDWLKDFIAELYPRRDVIYGSEKDSYITGKITFAKRVDYSKPIHNMYIEFWARKRFGGWRKMAKGITNKEGEFKLYFDFKESRKFKYRSKFHFEILQTTHVYFDKNTGKPKTQHEIFERIPIKSSELTGMGYNLGNIQLFYWEYRQEVPFPRVVIKDHDEDAPEYYSEGRNNSLQQQFIPIQLTKDKHLLQIDLDPKSLSIHEIQKDYPLNLTVAMEEKLPYSTRCDYWFGKRMMNGMNCATFLQDKIEKDHYWVKYFGACNYEVNDEYAFPTVETKFKIAENGLPLPVKIIMTGPINSHDKDPFQQHEFAPSDGEKWEQAKRVARVSGALSVELDDHFSGTHVNAEQYAIAVRRNLRKNPVANLLLPHLKEVVLMNHAADKLLIGPGYIPTASALTANGIIQRGKDMMGVQDWKGWHPMEILNERHTYAKAENLFWEIVNEFVDDFFLKNEKGIRDEWYEIYCFNKDLVEHSAPLFHSTLDYDKMPPEQKAFEKKRIEYYHERYRLDIDLPREEINGIKKCISSITNSTSNPGNEEIENLKASCKYIIMMATFMHTWVNEHQNEDIGEILYCSLGLRYGDTKEGIMRPEDDFSIAPDLTRSTQMMWFSNLLSRTEYGFITRNEEGDVDPLFAKLLNDKREEFAALDVNVDDIESRTNI